MGPRADKTNSKIHFGYYPPVKRNGGPRQGESGSSPNSSGSQGERPNREKAPPTSRQAGSEPDPAEGVAGGARGEVAEDQLSGALVFQHHAAGVTEPLHQIAGDLGAENGLGDVSFGNCTSANHQGAQASKNTDQMH